MGELAAAYGFTAIPHRTLSLGIEIGKGRFKCVHKAVLQRRPVAVLKYPLDSKNLSISAQNELDILGRLSEHSQNQHIPEIYGACQKKDGLWLAQEISSFGALRNVLLDHETSLQLTVTHRIHASSQLADALVFLKQRRIVHADLSCRNVLLFRLESDPALTVIKLVDFGLALTLPESSDHLRHKQARAVRWCAPETVKDSWLSHDSDAWSLGATLWELFSNGSAPWSNLVKRSDVTERLCALADRSASFDAVAEFPQPSGCPTVMHQAVLSVLRLNERDRSSVEELQDVLARVSGGEKVCMRSQVGPDESVAVSLEHKEKIGVAVSASQEEAIEQTLELVQALEDTIDDASEESDNLVDTIDDATEESDNLADSINDATEESDNLVEDAEEVKEVSDSSEDTEEVLPVFARRKSLLNKHTGEEEYFHPDDVEMEAGEQEAEIEASEVEDHARGEVKECSRAERQPQNSLLSTAATSQANSGATTPRTPPRVDGIERIFESRGPTHVAELNTRSSTPSMVVQSMIFPQVFPGGRFEHVPSPGTRASIPGTSFRNARSSSALSERNLPLRGRASVGHSSTISFALPRSSTGTSFQSLRSQSVVQDRGTVQGPWGFACQGPTPERAVKNSSGLPPPIMPPALVCGAAFSVMTSAGFGSPTRLSCPSRLA